MPLLSGGFRAVKRKQGYLLSYLSHYTLKFLVLPAYFLRLLALNHFRDSRELSSLSVKHVLSHLCDSSGLKCSFVRYFDRDYLPLNHFSDTIL